MVSISLMNLGITTPMSVYAQEVDIPFTSILAGLTNNLLPRFVNQFVTANQQAALMEQRAKLMQTTKLGTQQNQKFPGCQFPTMPKPLPQKCQEQEPSPQNIMALGLDESRGFVAGQLANQLESLTEAGEEGGFKCLTQLSEGIKKDIEVSRNELVAIKGQLKTQFEEAKILLDQRKDQVKTLHGHLTGGQPGDLAAEAFDLGNEFNTKSCKNILSKSALSQARGLRGIRDQIRQTMSDKATEFNQQKDTYERHTKELFKKVQKNIKKFGINKILGGGGQKVGLIFEGTQHLTQFKDIQTAVGTEVRSISEQTSNLEKLASQFKPGKKFEKNFQDKFVTSCVTGQDGSSFGMSADDFIRGLNFPSNLNGGNTKQNAEAAIRDIFGQLQKGKDVNLAIRELESFRRSYPSVTIRFTGRNAKEEQLPPNAVFRKALGNCQQRYNSDDNGAKKLNAMKKAHNGVKKMRGTLGTNLIRNLRDKILNCSGDGQSIKTSDCASGKAMSPAQPGFCIKKAKLCADSINNCEKLAVQKVKKKEKELAVAADNFNAGMAQLIALQKKQLTKINALVNSKRNTLFAISGVQGKLPEDVQIAFPLLKKSNQFGVSLMAGGDLSAIEKLPQKIDGIIKAMEGHGKAAMAEVDKEKELQKKNIQEMIARLKEVETTCMAGMKKARAEQKKAQEAQQRQMQEFMKKQQEEKQKAFKVCRDAMNMFSGPDSRPGCNGPTEKIADDIYKINASIDPSYMQLANTIRSHCGGNEKNGDRRQRGGLLAAVCTDFTSTPSFENTINISDADGEEALGDREINNVCEKFRTFLTQRSGCELISKKLVVDSTKPTNSPQPSQGNGNPTPSRCNQEIFNSQLDNPTDPLLSEIEYNLREVSSEGKVSIELREIGESLNPSCLGQQIHGRIPGSRDLPQPGGDRRGLGQDAEAL